MGSGDTQPSAPDCYGEMGSLHCDPWKRGPTERRSGGRAGEGAYPRWADVALFWAGLILRLEGVRGRCWRREPPGRPRAHPACPAHSGRVALFPWDPHPLSALSADHPADINSPPPVSPPPLEETGALAPPGLGGVRREPQHRAPRPEPLAPRPRIGLRWGPGGPCSCSCRLRLAPISNEAAPGGRALAPLSRRDLTDPSQ